MSLELVHWLFAGPYAIVELIEVTSMIGPALRKSVIRQLDKMVLFTMNRRMPPSFQQSYQAAPTLEEVLAETAVDAHKTAVYTLTAPGEHTVWLNGRTGPIACRVRVHLALDPQAPLLLYHHGISEIPYDSSWERIFLQGDSFPAHAVCVQAPYHANIVDPFRLGFASVESVYQMFAGSLRLMQAVQNQFEAQGAAFTVLSGVSWGGITSLLYAGLWPRVRAVAPMFASPNLAQVLWDTADLFARPIPLTRDELDALLDFTPYYAQYPPARIFPLLGEDDLFFRLEHHGAIADLENLVIVPDSHISGMWRLEPLRAQLRRALNWSAAHPC